MVFFNWATMQMAAKIVYYGPGLCGKTSNLSYIYAKTSPKSRGEMVSLETESDRTLFFDLLPIEVGTIGGFKTRLQLYTVPGQVFYNSTRKLVLRGVDGLVFVADSQRPMREANIESLKSLIENIEELGLSLDELPLVLQFNKRDLSNTLSEDELNADLNPDGTFPWHPASALNGDGVFETLKEITKVTLKKLRKRMAAPQADASPRPIKPAPAPVQKEPTPPGSPLPISASSLAQAAEEGAGPGTPDSATMDFPAFDDTETPAPETFGDSEHVAAAAFEDAAQEMPVEELDLEGTLPPADAESDAESGVEATPDDWDEKPSPNEITAPSISDLPIDEPFDQSLPIEAEADALDSPVEEESLEEIADIEDIEDIEEDSTEEEIVEFDTGTEDMPEIALPPVKRVHVSDENDILSELEDLRRNATETSFTRSKSGAGRKDLDIDSLLGGGRPRTRDLKRRIEHSLNSNLFKKMHSMQVALRIQDEGGDTMQILDPVTVEIEDASALEKLILQLTIDLENLR
ncbi:MAG: hypothetical protein DRJ61_02455 [Acidobacteria bacterium]|nr:MAG: hypothetical protein DRJ61_02455 [Acidobacteriota bacterium]